MLDPSVGVKCTEHILSNRPASLSQYQDEEIRNANSAIFNELHEWAAQKVAFGARTSISERFVKQGIQAVREKAKKEGNHFQQAYGVDPFTILAVCYYLFSIISTLLKWFGGQ